MERETAIKLLSKVKEGELDIDEAIEMLKEAPYTDLGFAKIDNEREIRQGVPEVIYGASKTDEQISEIVSSMLDSGTETVLVTRISADTADKLKANGIDIEYNSEGRLAIAGNVPEKEHGLIAVVTGGTSDIPVAEEAAFTAEALGNRVARVYDVGVAGLHRLLDNMDEIAEANCIIAVAGMEGALASVIGGLVDVPVIAVPTSVGYGASFEGLAALLAMLNSCSSGVSVVNIDNGFGAGYIASRINRMGE